ncbi:MAG: GNAT family N-acetyltransferase [Gemmatimonadota bacterium]
MDLRRCRPDELEAIGRVINAAAEAYRGVIPADCWTEPYMPAEALRREVAHGVVFRGAFDVERLVGVMGSQDVEDVTLIRHAYVRPGHQRQGIGGALLAEQVRRVERPVLVGTWRAASWAIAFYERHGFRRVPGDRRARLLRRYWSIPERQIEESVVLADERWCDTRA